MLPLVRSERFPQSAEDPKIPAGIMAEMPGFQLSRSGNSFAVPRLYFGRILASRAGCAGRHLLTILRGIPKKAFRTTSSPTSWKRFSRDSEKRIVPYRHLLKKSFDLF
jgi:hypothetical protein